MPEKLIHITVSVLLALLIVTVPCAVFLDIFTDKSPDAISQASIALPDQPSGDFVVYINTSLHKDTFDDWKSFFFDEYVVIFDDISCVTAAGDVSGQELAERFKAQLPENQMRVRTEDATLLVSKLEAGLVDAAVFSSEMAEMMNIGAVNENIAVIEIKGGQGDEKA